MNYGLLTELFELGAYVYGQNKTPYIFFNESGDWEPYLPKYESQSEYYETNGCTVWGTQNQIETFHNFLYGTEPNYSERFTYLLTPVDRNRGCDPQKVYECIRKYGLVDDRYFPTPESEEQFHDESAISGSLLARGQYWLKQYDLTHEWLWTTPPSNALEVLKEALKTSPIACSVTAWYRNEEGKYYDKVIKNNHWVMIYRIDDEGIHIFDSYDLTKKTLTHDHYIKLAKRIFVNKKNISGLIKQRNILQVILDTLMQKKRLVDYAVDILGTDVTPLDEYKDEVSCAWSMTALEQKVDPTFKRIPGTATLQAEYEHNPKFERVTEPAPDVRIICATIEGNPIRGHVGIFMDDMTIASNDSRTGKFIKNYTYETWRARWVDKGGYKIYMYKKK